MVRLGVVLEEIGKYTRTNFVAALRRGLVGMSWGWWLLGKGGMLLAFSA